MIDIFIHSYLYMVFLNLDIDSTAKSVIPFAHVLDFQFLVTIRKLLYATTCAMANMERQASTNQIQRDARSILLLLLFRLDNCKVV